MLTALLTAFLTILLTGCASHVPPPSERELNANHAAARMAWVKSELQDGQFDLASWAPQTIERSSHLTIYIEGDGLAWLNAERQSDDPTPPEATALQLALAQPSGARAYLARPCQFVGVSNCAPVYWGTKRFAPEVIASMDQAVSQLKLRFAAHDLTLVGYSGGATVAALLAERRSDVTRLVTVAGLLATHDWTKGLGLAALSGSLDPLDQRTALSDVAQWHFVGTRDTVVPAQLTRIFAAPLPRAKVIPIEGFDHQCCWVERWPELWASTNP